MEKIRLAVAGATLYAARLTECIRKNAPDDLEVFGCQCLEELTDFLTKTQPDILLCEPDAVQSNPVKDLVQIQLTDEFSKKQGKELDKVIFRYQRGSEILRQIFQIYEKRSKKNLICRCRTADMEIIAFYAPGGHELLLPFSISYASICGENARVLYLNFCEFSGMVSLFGEKEGNTCSDLIYGIRQKQEQFLLCLQSVLHHTEYFDYILPPENPEDIYEIQEEDLAFLLKMIQEQTEYTHVIFSCGTFHRAAEQVLACCGKIFCIVKENAFGKYRQAEFRAFLKKDSKQRIREKAEYISPQAGYGTFVQGMDLLAQIQGGEFAQQVRELTKYGDKEGDHA